MPNGDQEIGVCAHDTMTCEWVCPKTFRRGSWAVEFPLGTLSLPDALPGGTDYDAMVFTLRAYDLFVFPSQVLIHGYEAALKNRRAHKACLQRFNVLAHTPDCTWVCPAALRRTIVGWEGEKSLGQTYDAVVLTPSAYERFALPFQVADKGAARAYASYTVYLSRVRTRHAMERRP